MEFDVKPKRKIGKVPKRFQKRMEKKVKRKDDDGFKQVSPNKKSKEELLELRRKMMSFKAPLDKKRRSGFGNHQGQNSKKSPIKKAPKALLERLSAGKKQKISKKEMKKRTNKNYSKLFDVK